MLPRLADEKVFENEPTFPAVQNAAAVTALNPPIGRRATGLDANDLVLRAAVRTIEQGRLRRHDLTLPSPDYQAAMFFKVSRLS